MINQLGLTKGVRNMEVKLSALLLVKTQLEIVRTTVSFLVPNPMSTHPITGNTGQPQCSKLSLQGRQGQTKTHALL